jgi:hypothetical protein
MPAISQALLIPVSYWFTSQVMRPGNETNSDKNQPLNQKLEIF